MSDKTPAARLEALKENVRINSLVEKLRSKLKDFAVRDRQGELMGEVKDLTLDANHQLQLIVSKMAAESSSHLFLLISKLIQKIDPSNRLLIVDVNKTEAEHWPEYVPTETPGMETPKNLNNLASTSEAAAEGATQTGTDASMVKTPSGWEKLEATSLPEVVEEEIIRLLGERLVVDSSKRKVGEVIVRKEIETRMVQVPVRYERLIIEQVSPEHKQLAEIDLGQGEISGIDLNQAGSLAADLTVRGEFNSPKIASLVLNAIALERRHDCKQVRVEVVVENAERQKTYQEWFDRCGNQSNSL